MLSDILGKQSSNTGYVLVSASDDNTETYLQKTPVIFLAFHDNCVAVVYGSHK
jgi:hypothetical protein